MTEQRVTQVGALARINAGEQLRTTQAGVLVRIDQTVVRTTQAGVLVRMSPLVLQVTTVGVLVRVTPAEPEPAAPAPVFVFGLRDVRLWREDGVVALDGAQVLTFQERVKSGELSGNDHTLALAARADVLEWELEAGGLPLAAYGLMTGRAVTVAGDEPERTAEMTGLALDDFPIFRIYGRSLADDEADLHVKFFYCRLTGIPDGLFGEGEFWTTRCRGVALRGPDGLFEMVRNAAAQELDLPT